MFKSNSLLRKIDKHTLLGGFIDKWSLAAHEVLFEIVGTYDCLIGEKSLENRVLVHIEAGVLAVVEVLYVFVVPQETDGDLLEGAPLINFQEGCQSLVNLEPHFTICCNLIDRDYLLGELTLTFAFVGDDLAGYDWFGLWMHAVDGVAARLELLLRHSHMGLVNGLGCSLFLAASSVRLGGLDFLELAVEVVLRLLSIEAESSEWVSNPFL